MSYSTHSGKFARTMAQINPYMSGPVQPMRESRAEYCAGCILAAVIGVVLALALVAWCMA